MFPTDNSVKGTRCVQARKLSISRRRDVAGFNHDDKVLAGGEMFVWKGLNEQILFLGASVLKFWREIVNKLQDSILGNKTAATMLTSSTGSDDGIESINDLVQRLELTATEFTKNFKVADANFASLRCSVNTN